MTGSKSTHGYVCNTHRFCSSLCESVIARSADLSGFECDGYISMAFTVLTENCTIGNTKNTE